MTPRALTGLGIVSTVGIGREAFARAMTTPVALASLAPYPVESFDAGAFQGAALAEVRGFDPTKFLGDKGLRTLDRLTKLLVVATRLAMRDAGFKKDGVFVQSSPDRVGICCSNAYGSLEAMTELERVAILEDARYINPAKFPNTVANSAAGYASIWEDLRALNVAVSNGNCGALDAIACADIFLRTRRADAVLVGGAEAMSEGLYLAFRRIGALDTMTRLGEGAAIMSMESAAYARSRGASVLGEIVGYGTACLPSAPKSPLIHASHKALERAIRGALEDAALTPANVDAVASGVSGLAPFDDAELGAIRSVFGGDTCVAAPKFALGETLGASGAMGLATALTWFGGASAAPVVSGRQLSAPKAVVVTALGYYGNASAVVVRKPG